MHTRVNAWAFATSIGLLSFTNGLEIDLSSKDSVLNASSFVVGHILDFFPTQGNPPHTSAGSTPGILPAPYYWWNSALAYSSLMNYWAASGNDSIVPFVEEGMLFQIGNNENFMPANQTKSEGNDDQAFWGLAAMTAAEVDFPIGNTNTSISWLQLAKNVFESQAARWDDSTCGGGLRWQIFTFNAGYTYKNSASNGLFAELAARLYRFTGNETYADWAQRSVEWSKSVGIISPSFDIYDGTSTSDNCTAIDRVLWTYDAGAYLKAAAYISNVTESGSATSKYWNDLAQGIFNTSTQTFTYNDTHVIYETACEPTFQCNVDQQNFKGDFIRGLIDTRSLLTAGEFEPVRSSITSVVQASAKAAAASCTDKCAFSWIPSYQKDETDSIGSYLNTLEVFLANLPAQPILRANQTISSSSSMANTTASDNQTTTESDSPANTGSAALSVASPILALGGMLAMFLL